MWGKIIWKSGAIDFVTSGIQTLTMKSGMIDFCVYLGQTYDLEKWNH